MSELSGRVACGQRRAIVTGAAGTMGSFCARALANIGVKLLLVDIDQVMVRRLAQELMAEAAVADVLSDASIARLLRQFVTRERGADLLINAAGTGYVRNLGMIHVTRAFVEASRHRPATTINISSPTIRGADPFAHAGSHQAFRRMAEGLSDPQLPPGHTILTIDAPARPEQVKDAIAQWCCSSGCHEDPWAVLRQMPPILQ